MPNQYNAFDTLISGIYENKLTKKIAYIDEFSSYTFENLKESVEQVSYLLSDKGIVRNDRMLIAMLDRFSLPVTFLACIRSGVIPILSNTLLTQDDYQYMLQDSDAKGVFVSPEIQPLFTDLKSKLSFNQLITEDEINTAISSEKKERAQIVWQGPNDPCFWLYSSGSTGRPKGTVHKQSSMSETAKLYALPTLNLKDSDIIFSAAKLFFAYGLGNSLSFPLSVGATTILMSERPTPSSVFARLITHQPTVFFGVPTLYAALLADSNFPKPEQLNLRICVSAGEPLPEDIGLRWKEKTGLDIIDGIGSTEMLHIFLSNQAGQVKYGTTGVPVNGYDLLIADENGEEVDCDSIGDLFVKGPTAALEYWNQPEKTKSTFKDGWTKTGDKYKKDSSGFYTYCGRSDDMLKVGGIYVSPTEVENCLMKHPAVFEAAIVGRKDDAGLIKPEGFVVLNEGYQAEATLMEQLQSYVKETLAPYKYPRWLHFVQDLPKTATGKIQRFKLRNTQ